MTDFHLHFSFDEKNDLVRRVMATENIWALRENVTIPRDYDEPPVSPTELEANVANWCKTQWTLNADMYFLNAKAFTNKRSENKENIATKTDRRRSFKSMECGFCKNNGESSGIYSAHRLRDELGRVVCPRLRRVVCPICSTTGDNAHTIKYCPDAKNTTFCPESWRI